LDAQKTLVSERAIERFDRIRHSKGGNKPGEVRPLMQEAMQSSFGVFRRGDILKEGPSIRAG
jgi:succinate dehydrogenase / fumarate reductase flavoprotein subunit